MTMLELRGVTVRYGAVLGIEDVSFTVDEGEVVALLGANGAGKSTTLGSICGLIKPSAGQIHWQGERIDGRGAHRLARAGIALVPEGRQTFVDMSVADNLKIGAYSRRRSGQVKADLDTVFGYFPILKQRLDQRAGTLSGGEQQMLAIARGLVSRPKLLLLDEPSLGLAPLIVKEIFRIIRTISVEQQLSIVLVEQNARAAVRVASACHLLETGRITTSGRSEDLGEEVVRKLYLGV
jgi:branched-chain amino acid transport system ATP-binding protein